MCWLDLVLQSRRGVYDTPVACIWVAATCWFMIYWGKGSTGKSSDNGDGIGTRAIASQAWPIATVKSHMNYCGLFQNKSMWQESSHRRIILTHLGILVFRYHESWSYVVLIDSNMYNYQVLRPMLEQAPSSLVPIFSFGRRWLGLTMLSSNFVMITAWFDG